MGSNGDSTLEVPPAISADQNQQLITFISSLYKKDLIQRPKVFNSTDDNVEDHIKSVENYLSSIAVRDNIGKITVLFETLEQRVKNAIIFESSYDANSSNYEWVKEKLIELFPKRVNQTSSFIDLLNLKQNGQSLDEFILEIKNCLASNNFVEKSQREKVAVQILIKGLDNKQLAKAVNMQEPSSLKSARNLIQSVKNSDSQIHQINNVRKEHSGNGLHEEVRQLQKQVAYLTQMLLAIKSKFNNDRVTNQNQTLYNRNNMVNRQQLPINRSKNLNEWQQVRYKHNDRVRCFRCNKTGHIQRNCRSDTHVKQLHVTQYANQNKTDEYSDNDNQSYIESNESSIPALRTIEKHMPHKPKKYSQDIIDLENYINGKSDKLSYSGALMSEKRNNCAAITIKPSRVKKNKPIVKGRIHDLTTSLFLDSGAEVNVIDSSYLKSLNLPSDCILPVRSSTHTLKCANNSKMVVSKKVILPITIGVVQRQLPFLIVDQLSPNVIVGIRGMKKLGADIITSRSAVMCGGIEVPFVDVTEPDSLSSKNEVQTH